MEIESLLRNRIQNVDEDSETPYSFTHQRGEMSMVARSLATLTVCAICFTSSPAIRSHNSPTEFSEPELVLRKGRLPSPREFDDLAERNPIALLDASLRRYQAEVQSYRATLFKQERIAGKLHPAEEIRIAFREVPFSVLMLWDVGARRAGLGTVKGSLYVVGENQGKMIGWRPDAIFTHMKVGTRDANARAAARFGIEEFGLFWGAKRTYLAWLNAQERNELDCKYLGLQAVPELKNRICHVLQRTCQVDSVDPFMTGEALEATPENSMGAFRTVTIMIDRETWLQTGAVLKNVQGDLVASYFFHDVQLNPNFEPTEFTEKSLKNK